MAAVAGIRFHMVKTDATGDVHVHGCDLHPAGCNYFSDHTAFWKLGNKAAAKTQVQTLRDFVAAQVAVLTGWLVNIDLALTRLEAGV